MAGKRLTIEKNSQRVRKKIVFVRNRMKNEKETEGILWICNLRDHNVRKGKRGIDEDDYVCIYIYIYIFFEEVAIGFVGFFIIIYFFDVI